MIGVENARLLMEEYNASTAFNGEFDGGLAVIAAFIGAYSDELGEHCLLGTSPYTPAEFNYWDRSVKCPLATFDANWCIGGAQVAENNASSANAARLTAWIASRKNTDTAPWWKIEAIP